MTIYLDNAATSWPKPPTVARAAARVLKDAGGNPGRAGHDQATRAGAVLSDVRRQAAALFGATDANQVVFGLNGTDCLNMAMHGVLAGSGVEVGGGGGGAAAAGAQTRARRRSRGRVAHVITSAYDHNSVQRMLNAAEAAGVIELTRVGRIGEPIWRAADVLKALRPETVLVALTHASNVTGAVGDIAAVGAGLRGLAGGIDAKSERGPMRRSRAVLLVDAAQSAGVVPIDMTAMGIDLLAMPGHKGLMGPTGTGLLLVDREVATRLAPWRMGGTGLDSMDPFQPTQFPTRMEAGTANTFGLAGLQAALSFIEKHGVAVIGRHERSLRARLVARLSKGAFKNVIRLHAAADRRAEGRGKANLPEVVGVLSMDFFGAVAVSDVAAILNSDFGIALRSGLHCAPYTHRLIGTLPQGTLRVSPGFFNTAADIDRMAEALSTVLRAFKPARRSKARHS